MSEGLSSRRGDPLRAQGYQKSASRAAFGSHWDRKKRIPGLDQTVAASRQIPCCPARCACEDRDAGSFEESLQRTTGNQRLVSCSGRTAKCFRRGNEPLRKRKILKNSSTVVAPGRQRLGGS